MSNLTGTISHIAICRWDVFSYSDTQVNLFTIWVLHDHKKILFFLFNSNCIIIIWVFLFYLYFSATIYLFILFQRNIKPKNNIFWKSTHPQVMNKMSLFFMGTDLETFSITLLAHQWILCSEWVPSDWESKQLIKNITCNPHNSVYQLKWKAVCL